MTLSPISVDFPNFFFRFQLHGFVDGNFRFTQSFPNVRSHEQIFISSSVGCDKKPIVLINPNIKIQTETLSAKKSQDHRKKSLIDSGIELLFKKHPKSVKDGLHPSTTLHNKHSPSNELKFQPDVVLESKEQQHHQDKRWKPFDSIKIYTDKIKGHEDHHKGIIHTFPFSVCQLRMRRRNCQSH